MAPQPCGQHRAETGSAEIARTEDDGEAREIILNFIRCRNDMKVIMSTEAEDEGMRVDEDATNERSGELAKLLYREAIGRERPKALCYEDILIMSVRDPVTRRAVAAMSEYRRNNG
ncbi:hypothetical protein GE09DRAFT_1256535 [Coniochaeta sp. 2T2.1]|nr:hypothetical protein GE09DRAFT_1256535 [Coniochaeta sp. 2T2.1]